MAERTADIEQGRDAARRESWSEAYKALVAADPSDLSPQYLKALSEAAWWLSKIDEAIERNPPFAELADSIERSTGTTRAAAVRRLFSMPEPDDLRGALVEAGFDEIRIDVVRTTDQDGLRITTETIVGRARRV